MIILMVSAEAVPFAKTGGLADAVPALAVALKKQGHDVGIIMPRYYAVDRRKLKKLQEPLAVQMGVGEMWCAVYKTEVPGTDVPVWMIDREDLFGRQGLYGPDGSNSWPDNALRYAYLSAAAFQLSRYLRRIPDVLHLHDWQAAPAAWMLENLERYRGFEKTVSVLTIHNLGYQGVFPGTESSVFPQEALARNRFGLYRGDAVNFLAAGLNTADGITTVSPTYAEEILTPEYSEGLGDILGYRSDRLRGILNGMDYDEWNPSKDTALKPFNYDKGSLWKKSRLKARLQKEAGLPLKSRIPLFGMITRLTGQKGVDLIENADSPALKEFREGRAQLVILGTGESRYEEALADLGRRFPRNCGIRIAFSGPYSRLIEAGSDFFLMPSRYEPCGLNQMYSLRYGTLPLVRRTGGLADTVVDIDADPINGNGFVFDNSSSHELGEAINRAVAFYQYKRRVKDVRRRAMSLRFDWDASSRGYVDAYTAALGRRFGSA